ncbi:MAG: hypothetical protein ACYSWP_20280 [Planctomycetota bacterium]
MGLSCAIAIISLTLCIVTVVGYVIASKARNPQLDTLEFARSLE